MSEVKVSCRLVDKGIHTFYLSIENVDYYLFRQDYRKGVHEFFGGAGVELNTALNFRKMHHDAALMKTVSKIPSYIKYIEKEYEISVLKQTKKEERKKY